MSEPTREPHWEPLRADSPHSVNLDVDVPGDTTVRPCRPSLRAWAEAEREKLIRYGLLKLPEQPDQGEQK